MKIERFHMDNVEDNITVAFRHVVTLPTDIPGVVIFVGSDRMSEMLQPGSGSPEHVRRAAREVVDAFALSETVETARQHVARKPAPKAKKKARRKK